jgi:hypothetical protein
MSKPRLLVSIRARMETRYFRLSFPPLRASFQTLCESFATSCHPPTPRMQVSSRLLTRENSTLFTLVSGSPPVRDVHALHSPQLHTVPPHDQRNGLDLGNASDARSSIDAASSILTTQDAMTRRSCSCPLSPKDYHTRLTVFSLM